MSKSPHILKMGVSKDSASLRGRDVDFELQGVDVDIKLKSLLIRIAEIQHVNTSGLAEIAMMIDKMVDIISGMTTVADNMKAETDRLRNRREADVDDDVTTPNSTN